MLCSARKSQVCTHVVCRIVRIQEGVELPTQILYTEEKSIVSVKYVTPVHGVCFIFSLSLFEPLLLLGTSEADFRDFPLSEHGNGGTTRQGRSYARSKTRDSGEIRMGKVQKWVEMGPIANSAQSWSLPARLRLSSAVYEGYWSIDQE